MLYRKIWTVAGGYLLLFACLMLNAVSASAETKQAELITLERQGDLAVMFTFDSEPVDIVFISPSGQEKRVSDPDVEFTGGGLWSTYRISDAEAGTWLVEYDLKSNSGIDYSIIEDDFGLWIQYLEVDNADGEKILSGGGEPGAVSGGQEEKTVLGEEQVSVRFEAECESEVLRYNYTLYAIDTLDTGANLMLSSGTARSGEEKQITVRLTSLSGGSYVLRLEVYYRTEAAEIFDSVDTMPFDYANPNEPNSMENFALDIDTGNLTCAVDWKAYAKWGHDSYRLSVYGDGQQVYSGELDKSVKAASVVFPEGTKELTVALSYKDNGVWSSPLSKTVDLNREYIRLTTGEVTNAGQAALEYLVLSERLLELSVNGTEGSFLLQDKGELSFDLVQGENHIHASIESEPLICLVIDKDIYFDPYPPEIKLFEGLDGKTFSGGSIDIPGKITGGSRMLVNGGEVKLGENGEFCVSVELAPGENVITIEALDVNGNSALMNLTLYRASKGLGADGARDGAPGLFPLLGALAASLLIIIFSAIFMRKKAKEPKTKERHEKVFRRWKWLLWDGVLAAASAACIYGFAVCYRRVNSMAFLELAEKSASTAVRYLRLEKAFAIASLGLLILLALSAAITVIRTKKREKAGTGEPAHKEE